MKMQQLGIIVVAFGLVAGCGGGNNQCVPGQAIACACPDGTTGQQTCADGSYYNPCTCTAHSGTGGNSGSSSNVGPISIGNPSATRGATGEYDLNFVVDNPNGAVSGEIISRVNVIRLSWAGTTLTWSAGCDGLPWRTYAATSSPVSIVLYTSANLPSSASAIVSCSSGQNEVAVGTAATTPANAIALDVEGVLNDGATFKAAATAPLM